MEEPAPAPPAISAGWVAAAGLAAQLALVVAPLVQADLEPGPGWGIATLIAPAMLGAGLIRRSAAALLVLVPAGWALPAYDLPAVAFEGALGPVALLTVAAYLTVALRWLRPRQPLHGVSWEALDGDAPPAPPRLAALALCLVAGPAVGAFLWPDLLRRAAVGFPAQAHQVAAGAAVLGTLFGLVLAARLARPRPRWPGRRERAAALAVGAAVLLALWAGLRA